MASFVKDITESIRADDRPGMDADAVADLGSRVKHSVGEEMHFPAENTIRTQMIAAMNGAARADLDAFPDDAMGTDGRSGINLGRRCDLSGRIDSRGRFGFREKDRQDMRHGHARVG